MRRMTHNLANSDFENLNDTLNQKSGSNSQKKISTYIIKKIPNPRKMVHKMMFRHLVVKTVST